MAVKVVCVHRVHASDRPCASCMRNALATIGGSVNEGEINEGEIN